VRRPAVAHGLRWSLSPLLPPPSSSVFLRLPPSSTVFLRLAPSSTVFSCGQEGASAPLPCSLCACDSHGRGEDGPGDKGVPGGKGAPGRWCVLDPSSWCHLPGVSASLVESGAQLLRHWHSCGGVAEEDSDPGPALAGCLCLPAFGTATLIHAVWVGRAAPADVRAQ